jgi:hypothetical protein
MSRYGALIARGPEIQSLRFDVNSRIEVEVAFFR